MIEKPSYLSTTNTRTLKDSVRSRLETLMTAKNRKDLRLQHRLDWETSGIMVAAKHVDAARSLATQFQNRTVKKVYVADVVGVVPFRTGTISIPLSMDPKRRPLQRVDYSSTGKIQNIIFCTSTEGNAYRLVLKPGEHQLVDMSMGATNRDACTNETWKDDIVRVVYLLAELCFVHPQRQNLIALHLHFPLMWRGSGHKILVLLVENSHFLFISIIQQHALHHRPDPYNNIDNTWIDRTE